MNKEIEKEELKSLLEQAEKGDKEALEAVILSVQDMVFNLSLRMLGSFADAEDAAQDILLKIMTHLSAFRKESAFTTWVFSIATNYLINYKKHMFAQRPVSFEYYGEDIEHAGLQDIPDLSQGVEEAVLAEELKMSCTNVLLQCLDAESRCIFIMGTMFRLDSRIAGDILGLTPQTYRQRLSRIRKRVAEFLQNYCGEYGSGSCRCKNRIHYAVQSHRLNPAGLEYSAAKEKSIESKAAFKQAMEEMDDLAVHFSFCKMYQSPERTRQFFLDLMESSSFSTVRNT